LPRDEKWRSQSGSNVTSLAGSYLTIGEARTETGIGLSRVKTWACPDSSDSDSGVI